MPRKQKKYHYIYKTTCNVTERYYIGMHSTDDLEDGYVGSDKRLWYSINKYGKENHTIEILEFLKNRKELKEREKEIINEEMLLDDMCMNLALGGEDGFSSKEHYENFKKACKNNGSYHKMMIETNLNYRKNHKKNWMVFRNKQDTSGKIMDFIIKT